MKTPKMKSVFRFSEATVIKPNAEMKLVPHHAETRMREGMVQIWVLTNDGKPYAVIEAKDKRIAVKIFKEDFPNMALDDKGWEAQN